MELMNSTSILIFVLTEHRIILFINLAPQTLYCLLHKNLGKHFEVEYKTCIFAIYGHQLTVLTFIKTVGYFLFYNITVFLNLFLPQPLPPVPVPITRHGDRIICLVPVVFSYMVATYLLRIALGVI